MIIKDVKQAELNIKIVTAFLNTQTLKMISQNANVNIVTKVTNKVERTMKS